MIFLVVAGDQREAQRLPVLLGLVDPVARGGDEVPEDIARRREGLAAHQHQPAAARARQPRLVARAQDVEREQLERLAIELGLAADQHHRALVGVGSIGIEPPAPSSMSA